MYTYTHLFSGMLTNTIFEDRNCFKRKKTSHVRISSRMCYIVIVIPVSYTVYI